MQIYPHVHKHHVHAAFFRELPNELLCGVQKNYAKSDVLLVGALGIEPTTSPVWNALSARIDHRGASGESVLFFDYLNQ